MPFAKTKQERVASTIPRLSLEERYGSHDGYVAAVRAAADNAACKGYLHAGAAAAATGRAMHQRATRPAWSTTGRAW